MRFLHDYSGQAGVAVIFLLGTLSMILLGVTGFVTSTGLKTHRMALVLEDETRLWKEAGLCLRALETLWIGDDGPSQAEWADFCRTWEDRGCRVRELSSRINPCWISKDLISGPGFAKWFISPEGPAELVREREEKGFSLDLTYRLEDLLNHRDLLDLFSPWSGFNLLTGDSSALAQAYGGRTGNASAAEVFRLRLSDGRINRRKLDTTSVQALLAPYDRELSDLFSWQAPVNLNLVEEEELRCLVQSRIFDLPAPEEVYRHLLDLRNKGFVHKEEIDALVEAASQKKTGRSWELTDWLGSASTHFGIFISGFQGDLELVLHLVKHGQGEGKLVPVFHALTNREGERKHGS